ncbi:hypothetical protein PanWU01x14_147380, partial [Parasponia andersonii]
ELELSRLVDWVQRGIRALGCLLFALLRGFNAPYLRRQLNVLSAGAYTLYPLGMSSNLFEWQRNSY